MSAFKKTAGSFSFKYDISLPKICCMWGGPMDDQKKNFSGLVGDLLNGYSDIGWANLFFNLDQAQVMDYTDAYAVDYLAWMVKQNNVLPRSASNTKSGCYRHKSLTHCHFG